MIYLPGETFFFHFFGVLLCKVLCILFIFGELSFVTIIEKWGTFEYGEGVAHFASCLVFFNRSLFSCYCKSKF